MAIRDDARKIKIWCRRAFGVGVGGLILVLAGHGIGAGWAQTPPELTGIAVTPANSSLSVGDGQSFTATGTFSDSSTQVLGSAGTTVSTMDAGAAHTCAVFTDGSARCWGYNAYGELGDGTTTDSPSPVAVNGIATATAIAGGLSHTCTRLGDGTLRCWGANSAGALGDGSRDNSSVPVPVIGITTATAVTAGTAFSCAVLADGSARCWGGNGIGELGNGGTASASTPQMVSGIASAVAITAGQSHACALLADGSVRCWGGNSYGQLGNGSTIGSLTPVAVNGITTATAISAGTHHTCALLAGGSVRCWGRNSNGALGNGSFVDSPTPVAVGALTNLVAIAAGGAHTCARLVDRSLRCWGDNQAGGLGNGNRAGSSVPVVVNGIANATEIAAGGAHTCALLVGGPMTCWGSNRYGQLGNGSLAYSVTPVGVSAITSATMIAAGNDHTCAGVTDQTALCWGSNRYGQLGTGNTVDSPEPVAVRFLTDVAAIDAGGQHTCALATNSELRCWGSNFYGQAGDPFNDPTVIGPVSGVFPATAVAAGALHTCAVLVDGSAQCWGSNMVGQLGNGTTSSTGGPGPVSGIATATAIAAGREHTCAILAEGTAQCWGSNTAGQLGNGTTISSSTPVAVSGISTATAIAAGGAHTCAILADGTVRCWGLNFSGQLGDGGTNGSLIPVAVIGITNAAAITAGEFHACALLLDQTIRCWGWNDSGQLGNGSTADSSTPVAVSGVTNAAAISAGFAHTCAVRTNGTATCWGNNYEGQLGNGDTGYSLTPVAVVRLPTGVVWSTDDPAVLSVTSQGIGAAVGIGITTVTATLGAVSGTTAVAVNASATTRTLKVSIAGTGGGAVSSNPAGINCSATCAASFNTDTVVTLTATSDPASTFGGWSGACTGTAGCQVTMDAARSVTATFSALTAADLSVTKIGTPDPTYTRTEIVYDITVTNNGPDTATGVVLTDTLPPGVNIAPTPIPNCSSSGGTVTCTIGTLASGASTTVRIVVTTTTSSGTVTNTVCVNAAESDPNPSNDCGNTTTSVLLSYWLSTFVASGGAITVNPPSNAPPPLCAALAGLNCYGFVNGTSVTLTALPVGGYEFQGWTGDCAGQPNPCVLLMDSDKSVAATFGAVHPPPSGFTNMSTRAFVGTGSNAAVGGFIISGTGTKQVLIRGFGPTLTSFGVAGALANPTLDLYWDNDNNPSTPAILILTNNDWGTALASCPAPVVACGTPQAIFDTGLSADSYAPSNPNRALDAALLLTMPTGTYTVRLSGVSGGAGVGLVGVDDVDVNQSATLTNISTRAFVGTGTNVAVGGFIINGTSDKQVLLRGFGPTLSSFGITGALGNPTLDLFWDNDNNPNTLAILVVTNNDWGTALGSCPTPVVACGTPQDIFDTGLSADTYAPSNPNRGLDAALLLTLPPGTYTARLSGVSNGVGVGLIGMDQVFPPVIP